MLYNYVNFILLNKNSKLLLTLVIDFFFFFLEKEH